MGVANLTDTELLALVLGSGTAKQDVMAAATQITRHFNYQQLQQVTIQQLTEIPGVGPTKAGKIIAAIELGLRLNTPQTQPTILQPTDVLPYVTQLRRSHREQTMGIYLNARHELLDNRVLTVGTLDSTILEPRDVFAPALALPCRSLILVHNHPSGSLVPSQEDRDSTQKLVEAGKLLGIQLLDHIIVSAQGHSSLQELGLI